jgi:hypothetical protein
MQDRIEAGEYVRPCDGETLSGDAVVVHSDDAGVFVAVIDALGHGPNAHELARELSGVLSKWLTWVSTPNPDGALAVLHESARGTRGAVAAVAWLDSRTLEGSSGHRQRAVPLVRQRCEDRRIQGGRARLSNATADAYLFRFATGRCASLVFRRRDRSLRCQRISEPYP